MSSIGVRRSLAACASPLLALAAALSIYASDCPPKALTAQQTQQRLEELSKNAQRAMSERQFADAVGDFKEAVCLSPRDARIFYSLGSTQAALGDFLAARKSFASADRLQPNNPLSLAMLVRVDVSMADADSLKAALLEAATRFAGDNALHATLAQFLAQNKLFDLALAESLRSQKAGAMTGQSLLELAVLENTVGAYDEAIRNAVAVETRTDLPSAVRASAAGVAGLSYESAGQPEAAISHLREAIQLDPSQENSYLALAFLLEKTQKYPEAVDVLEQGHKILPESIPLLLPLGSDLILAERYEAGVSILQELLRKSPNEYEAYLRMADAFRKMAKYDQEITILQELAGRNPSHPAIHLLLARAILNSDPVDYGKALEELALAEKSMPPDADIFYLRGKVYLATNRNEEAAAALRRAIELKPLDPASYYQLGRLYEKLGQVQLARDAFAHLQYLKNNDAR